MFLKDAGFALRSGGVELTTVARSDLPVTALIVTPWTSMPETINAPHFQLLDALLLWFTAVIRISQKEFAMFRADALSSNAFA